MFFQAVPGSNPGISRPFIVGLVMLLLFLSMQVNPLIQGTKHSEKAHHCRLPSTMVNIARMLCRRPECLASRMPLARVDVAARLVDCPCDGVCI